LSANLVLNNNFEIPRMNTPIASDVSVSMTNMNNSSSSKVAGEEKSSSKDDGCQIDLAYCETMSK
jgi:hypothetical protein